MNQTSRTKVLHLFEDNLERIRALPASPPVERVTYWRESPHRTLGHLTACQAAWLPLMRAIRERSVTASIPIRPDPLFTKLGFAKLPWEELLGRFISDRDEWGEILHSAPADRQLKTSSRVYTALSLTKRLVDHERNHLNQLENES